MFDVTGWVRLGEGEDRRIRDGHLWVYRNEITGTSEPLKGGDIVWIKDSKGRKLGLGTVNLDSMISVRLLSRGAKQVFTEKTFSQRLSRAITRRKHLTWDARRLVNAEGDLLPGLIVDMYADVVVAQLQIACWERRKDLIPDEIDRIIKPRVIVLRNDSLSRKAEGLELYTDVAKGSLEENIIIREGELDLEVDVLSGQKTGFYIDQRENRKLALAHVEGKNVLDCCSYTGAWSLMCAKAGARQVLGLDCSQTIVDLACRNARRNSLDHLAAFRKADVFDELQRLAAAKEKYDVIILDPPSLAKTRRAIAGAERGYVHLNKLAMGLLSPGGLLVTCSCSHHISQSRFREMLTRAASLARKQVSVLKTSGQPEDHPWLLGLPETNYLKCFLLQVA
jgi:23S rRNA (cytosine1962-C5)-methyltransferase